mmetsp:Transcript_14531/g.20781  ORF Transcript_14531/g.20781 Transcript_14531/m.20781 type:complete len:332 (+) Transcript_14531:95-1090(+)|eukprot:CAMPEP_0172426440 /NCGR_PEP_ID=MMETSP1064-20121228/37398_1 /TAXON_ID=202472 /ORGANISM="Aulacoseira subarctica , Strain CCAP 1002/5" /LENGTH=331 /DNA_ID=CAMNT_0013170037 /DNA_START=86 /DNA_END=1081 /DNA_ORIENTATION=+
MLFSESVRSGNAHESYENRTISSKMNTAIKTRAFAISFLLLSVASLAGFYLSRTTNARLLCPNRATKGYYDLKTLQNDLKASILTLTKSSSKIFAKTIYNYALCPGILYSPDTATTEDGSIGNSLSSNNNSAFQQEQSIILKSSTMDEDLFVSIMLKEIDLMKSFINITSPTNIVMKDETEDTKEEEGRHMQVVTTSTNEELHDPIMKEMSIITQHKIQTIIEEMNQQHIQKVKRSIQIRITCGSENRNKCMFQGSKKQFLEEIVPVIEQEDIVHFYSSHFYYYYSIDIRGFVFSEGKDDVHTEQDNLATIGVNFLDCEVDADKFKNVDIL